MVVNVERRVLQRATLEILSSIQDGFPFVGVAALRSLLCANAPRACVPCRLKPVVLGSSPREAARPLGPETHGCEGRFGDHRTLHSASRFRKLVSMDGHYSIGELAREAGVPTSTVRYYERVGLVRPDGRSGSNYRFYRKEALERLRFIRAAQSTGFAIQDISRLLDFRDGATAPCEEVQTLIEERLSETKSRMSDLRRTESVLKACLKLCRTPASKDRCQVMEKLDAASSTRPVKSRRPSRAKK